VPADLSVPSDEASQRYAGEMEAAILDAMETLLAIEDGSPKRATSALARKAHDRLLALMDKIDDERNGRET